MRVDNWDSKLEKVLQDCKNKKKFIRGKNDCITFVIDCIQAITGKKVFDKKYKTLKEAKEIIKAFANSDGGAIAVNGKMVDEPVVKLMKKHTEILKKIENI